MCPSSVQPLAEPHQNGRGLCPGGASPGREQPTHALDQAEAHGPIHRVLGIARDRGAVRECRQVRSSFERGDLNSLSIPMSTRTLYKWADNYLWLLHSTGTPEEKLYVSFQQALGARYNSTDRQVVCQLARAIFGEAWPAIEH